MLWHWRRNRVGIVGSGLAGEKIGGSAAKLPAIADFKFLEEQGDVKLDGAFGDLESRGDFFVSEALKNGAKNLFLTMAELNGRNAETAILDDFFGACAEALQEIFVRADGDDEIAG